jgi:hypothetical protein
MPDIRLQKFREGLDTKKFMMEPLVPCLQFMKKLIGKTPYYFPTPGLMISREIVAHLPFNENLIEREHLWFAHKIIEYQFRLQQSPEVSLVVNQNSIRSINRTDLVTDLAWAERLELVDSVARDNFLMGIAFRNAAIRFDWCGMRQVSNSYRNHHWIFKLIAGI